MHGKARFLLAWEARAGERWEEALAHLEASLREGPQEESEGIGGRTEYWRARTLLDLDRRADAVAAYAALAGRYPLSYYAQLALARVIRHRNTTC